MANEIEISNSPEQAVQYDNPTEFGLLSDVYKIRIRMCDKTGAGIGNEQVIGVAVEGDFSVESQYSTPFENSNPEHRLPTMIGMMQAGDWVNTLDTVSSNIFGIELGESQKDALNKLEGRSNLTKVNSTQIFTATQPVSLNLTILFSAWRSALTEVENQVMKLVEWGLPQKLAEESTIANLAQDLSLESAFPSLVPPYVSVHFGGKKYVPMLIQSVNTPLVVPMDKEGNRIQVQVPVHFVSRTAWDALNIQNLRG